MINGKSGTMRKIDESTLVFEFPDPNYLFLDILAGSTAMGGGRRRRRGRGGRWAPTCRRTISSSSIPKYVAKDEPDTKAKEPISTAG